MNNAQDFQPIDVECDACGARAGEECRPGCLGKAKHDDEQAEEIDAE